SRWSFHSISKPAIGTPLRSTQRPLTTETMRAGGGDAGCGSMTASRATRAVSRDAVTGCGTAKDSCDGFGALASSPLAGSVASLGHSHQRLNNVAAANAIHFNFMTMTRAPIEVRMELWTTACVASGMRNSGAIAAHHAPRSP